MKRHKKGYLMDSNKKLRNLPEQENNSINSSENLNSSTTSEESFDSSVELSSIDDCLQNPVSTSPLEKPKKRWLREAAQELGFNTRNDKINNENQQRPTVLVRAKPLNNIENNEIQDWQGALALMELANGTSSVPFYTQL